MEKVKLEFKAPKSKTIEYNGVEIEINPFLGVAEQIVLINRYIYEYFREGEGIISSSEYHYMEAEYNLMNYLFQSNTNIDPENLNENIYGDVNLWHVITSAIVNYADFRMKLDRNVADVKERIAIHSSVGEILENLIKEGYDIISKFAEITPEQVQAMQKEGQELIKQLQESPAIGKSQIKQ